MEALRVYRGLLANRPLTKLLTGEFISGIGDWLYIVAIFVVIYRETNDAAAVGLFGAVRLIPYILLSVPAGLVADRFDRRLVLLVSDLVRGGVMLVLAYLVATNGPILAIVGFAMVAASGSTFFYPAMGAYLPSLAADERQLGPANSAWASIGNLSFIVGPAIGGILIAAGDVVIAFLLNGLSFLVIAAILWTLPPSRPGDRKAAEAADAEQAPAAEPSPATSSSEPAPVAPPAASPWSQLPLRPVSGLVLIQFVIGFFDGGIQALTVILAVTVLNAGEQANGFLNAAIGVGGLIGAVVSGVLVLRRQLARPLLAGAFLVSVGAAALGAFPVLGIALLAIGLTAAGSIVLDVVLTTVFQRLVPDELRGRAFGVLMTLNTVSAAVGAFVLPILVVNVGALPALGAAGGAILLASIVGLGLLGGSTTRPASPFEATLARAAALPLFAGVPAARLEAALGQCAGRGGARSGHRPAGRRGRPVLHHRDRHVQRHQLDGSGNERILRQLGPDEVFGEIGLLNEAPRSATVAAETTGKLLEMDGDDFLQLVGASGDVRAQLLGLYAGGSSARSR